MSSHPQAEWVALNYVPFAERSLEVVVDLYHKTACHKAVINEKVLQNVIKVPAAAPLTSRWDGRSGVPNGLPSANHRALQ